jgi:hypothetical protein
MKAIPKSAKKRPDNILALGESTGHYHEATGPGVALYELSGKLILDAPEGSVVTHQEHGPVTLPPGRYERRIVREYSHLDEEARDVVD